MTIESLIIRVRRQGASKQEQRLADVLATDDDSQLDFGLPEFYEWPQGAQSISHRGRLLMLAGLKYLQQNYPESQSSVAAAKMQNLAAAIDKEVAPVNQSQSQVQKPINGETQGAIKINGKKNKPDFDLSMFQ